MKSPTLLLTTTTIILLLLSLFTATTTAATPPVPPSYRHEYGPNIPTSLGNASDALAFNKHVSWSLMIDILAPDDLPIAYPPKALTIFAPPDSAFIAKGQPRIHQALLHFSPVYISPDSIKSLRAGHAIPSLATTTLVVTDSYNDRAGGGLVVNNVGVDVNPIFDDGAVVVYAVTDLLEDVDLIKLLKNKLKHFFV